MERKLGTILVLTAGQLKVHSSMWTNPSPSNWARKMAQFARNRL